MMTDRLVPREIRMLTDEQTWGNVGASRMRRSIDAAQVRSVRGRPFLKRNPGRKPGSKNVTTLVAEAIVDGEKEELIRKGLELAKAGNVPLLKFFLERLLPRERQINIDIPPMKSADDAVDALGKIVSDIALGNMTSSEGAGLATILNSYRVAIDQAEIEKRLEALETKLIKTEREL